jgi:hypothetical protein
VKETNHDLGHASGRAAARRRSEWHATWRVLEEEFAALVPGATHIIAAGSGHYVYRDDLALVTRVLRDLARQAAFRGAAEMLA